MEEADLTKMLARSRRWMKDQQVPDEFSAVELRQPGGELAREWAKRHLRQEMLAEARVLDPATELRGWDTTAGGRVGCVSGRLQLLAERDGAVEYRLQHPSGQVSGGWIVGEVPFHVRDPATICGIVVGRLVRGQPRGLFVVGLLKTKPATGRSDEADSVNRAGAPQGRE